MPTPFGATFFHKWPKDLPHRGVLVTNFNEQIPFDGFMTTETMLLVERRTPDTIGARKLILPYGNMVSHQAHRRDQG